MCTLLNLHRHQTSGKRLSALAVAAIGSPLCGEKQLSEHGDAVAGSSAAMLQQGKRAFAHFRWRGGAGVVVVRKIQFGQY